MPKSAKSQNVLLMCLGVKREVFFAYRILDFHFFPIFFFAHGSIRCYLQCDGFDLNVKFLIFFKRFTSSTVSKFSVKTPINKMNSSSLIFTSMKLRFELCMPYLV
jgi:hypothetical protein